MTQVVTPSEKSMTAGQIDKAVANYRALLDKHAHEFGAEPVQTVLGQAELAEEMLGVFRRRIEAISNMIVRHVRVDRSRTPQQAIAATRRVEYCNDVVVKTMPTGEGDEVDVYFVPTKRSVPAAELDAFLAQYGLVSDPRAQAAVNEADPAFADEIPNGSQWVDAEGEYCYLAFDRWRGLRSVYCSRYGRSWDDSWWFAGVRK